VPETAWITNVATATWNGMTASDQWVLPASPHQFLPALGRNSCNDFADDFGNPASGWLVKENDIDRLGYLSGEYQMFIKQPYYIGVEVPTCPRANYEVESRMRWVGAPGSYYGLAFGRAGDWSQYYLFAVSAEASRFAIFRLDGASTTLVNWTANAAILGGEGQNTLRVMRNGTTITALVNNVAVATLSDSAFGGLTGVGLIAAAHTGQFGVDARFDDVSVRLLPGDGLASLSGSATLADAGADIRDIPGGALAGPGARRAP
jgi:hypothetical protein